MGKGTKKRSTKSSDSALKPAPNLAAEGSHGSHPQEQLKPNAPLPSSNAEKPHSLNVDAAPFSYSTNKAPLNESSSSQRPNKASSVPCRFFQRGYCRYGNFCRFQHLGASSSSAPPFSSAAKVPPPIRAKAPSEKSCAPEECRDWHLTGSCPRYRTCRYAHPINHDVEGSRKHTDPGMGLKGFEDMVDRLVRQGLSGSRGGRGNDKMAQRMENGGFTDDDVYELSLQGIKPWDPEAWDALAVLKGFDMDGGFGYGYDDDDDDDDDELLNSYGF